MAATEPMEDQSSTKPSCADSNPPASKDNAAATLKPPPESNTATIDNTDSTSTEPQQLPTYHSTEESKHFLVATALLREGAFEDALSTIEEGLETTMAALPKDDSNAQLHESLAPFYYLYGSTLLYSIEESSDPNQQMTQTGSGDGDEAPADEIEIAWENLETARTILDRMILEDPQSKKLQTDLAQVHLRAADLQRLNGRYEGSVADYQKSLQYREATEPNRWSRKIADIHYNLGLVSFHQVATMNAASKEAEPKVDMSQLEIIRSRGLQHYYQCATIFGGIVAQLLGLDPQKTVQDAEANIPNFKSTGERDEDEKGAAKIISLKLQSLRTLLSGQPRNDDIKVEVETLLSVLDEIQETIDEAETSEQGMKEVTSMKEQIAAAVAAQGDNEEGESSSGFGTASAAASTAVANSLVVKKKKRKETDSELDGEQVATKKAKSTPSNE